MMKQLPWGNPAVIGVKRRGDLDFLPEVAGLSLNGALQQAIELRVITSHMRVCIWVQWDGRERMIQGRRLLQLATDPGRPPLADGKATGDGTGPCRRL